MSKKIKVFYDGNCKICDQEISYYKKNDINLFEYIKIIKNFISDKKSDIESLTPINFFQHSLLKRHPKV